MKTENKLIGSSKTNIIKNTKFVLRTQLALPEKGLHSAVIGDVTNESGVENFVEINRIRVPVTGVKDSNGNPVALEKVYNIGSNGRGFTALLGDYSAWSGIKVAKDEVYGFDVPGAFNGKAVVVEVGYHVTGSKVTPYIRYHRGVRITTGTTIYPQLAMTKQNWFISGVF